MMNDAQRGHSMRLLAGVDEVGRGPLAGPVVVAVVVFDPVQSASSMWRDSKSLSARKREQLAEAIIAHAVAWRVVFVGVDIIDRLNILKATHYGMSRVLDTLNVAPDQVLVDGRDKPKNSPTDPGDYRRGCH